jgi:hypothetical protein
LRNINRKAVAMAEKLKHATAKRLRRVKIQERRNRVAVDIGAALIPRVEATLGFGP